MPLELAASLSPTEEDRLLQAEAAVRAYCGWHIAPSRVETLTVDGTGSPVLLVPSLFVTDVADIVDNETAVEATYYTWRQNGVIELWTGGWWTDRKVEVTLTHGYDDVPAEVAAVVQRVAARALSDPGAAQQVGQVRFAVSLTTGAGIGGTLSDYDRELLAPYKIPQRP